MNIQDLRENYTKGSLDIGDIDPSPFLQFQTWFSEALAAKLPEPNAMTISTLGENNRLSSRIVLLKGFDTNGFVFYTNYLSKKGIALAQNSNACINFYWAELERQVRIEGKILKTSAEISDNYFKSRPRGSQIGAVVSAQSTVIASREELEIKTLAFEKQYEGQSIPRPEHWGGYCLAPDYIEFWQGRPSRLHDRIAYSLIENAWKIERLSP